MSSNKDTVELEEIAWLNDIFDLHTAIVENRMKLQSQISLDRAERIFCWRNSRHYNIFAGQREYSCHQNFPFCAKPHTSVDSNPLHSVLELSIHIYR